MNNTFNFDDCHFDTQHLPCLLVEILVILTTANICIWNSLLYYTDEFVIHFNSKKIAKPNFSLYKIKCTYSLLPFNIPSLIIDRHVHMASLFKTKTTNRSKFLLLDSRAVVLPSFLAPGTRFMEDKFSKDPGLGMVSGWFKHIYIYCTLYF